MVGWDNDEVVEMSEVSWGVSMGQAESGLLNGGRPSRESGVVVMDVACSPAGWRWLVGSYAGTAMLDQGIGQWIAQWDRRDNATAIMMTKFHGTG